MPKPRTKRLARKRQLEEEQNPPKQNATKRRKVEANPNAQPVRGTGGFYIDTGKKSAAKGSTAPAEAGPNDATDGPDPEFFGFLTDEEQEYFRSADELLELDQFGDPDERAVFVANVFREAQGKELKMACSQGCSRLMERMIGLARRPEVRRLFSAFAGHYLTLVQHRFASHCVEALFVKAAPMVTKKEEEDTKEDGADGEDKTSMEDLFLLTLDEFDGHIEYLVTDSFASHTLRVLLIVLSGCPLEDAAVKWLLRSKRKMVAVPTGESSKDAKDSAESKDLRPVPASFQAAVQKIISDATATLDTTSARVLARHPVGNPTLQLLLQLDLANKGGLVDKMLPDTPQSFADPASPASEFITTMIFDPIGSRLVEVLATNCQGKFFKGLYASLISPNMQTYARSEVASYTVVRALNRLSKDDLVKAVRGLVPALETLVAKGRWNVVKTMFERCGVRRAEDDVLSELTDALISACGEPEKLVVRVCELQARQRRQKKSKDKVENEDENENQAEKETDRDEGADEGGDSGSGDPQENHRVGNKLPENRATKSQSHGAGVISAMLAIAGAPCEAAHVSLLSLDPQQVVELATGSMATVTVLTAALASPHRASNPRDPTPQFHTTFVSILEPLLADLAATQFGHNLAKAVAAVSSAGPRKVAPFHVKERIAQALAGRERELKAGWMGRSVWRTWRLDTWTRKRADWRRYIKEELEPAPETAVEAVEAAETPMSSRRRPTTLAQRPRPMGPAQGKGVDRGRGVKGRATGGS